MLIVDIDKLFKSFATEYIKENKEKINGGEDDAESLYTAFQTTLHKNSSKYNSKILSPLGTAILFITAF